MSALTDSEGLRLWCGKPASCVPFSVFPIIYNFVYHRIENNTGISMCAAMINRKTLSCKQMCLFLVCKNLLIVPFHLSFFLSSAPIASLVVCSVWKPNRRSKKEIVKSINYCAKFVWWFFKPDSMNCSCFVSFRLHCGEKAPKWRISCIHGREWQDL